MRSGGDPVGGIRRNKPVEGCGESEINPPEVQDQSSPEIDGAAARAGLRQIEDGKPHVFMATMGGDSGLGSGFPEDTARRFARQLKLPVERIQEMARTAEGLRELDSQLKAFSQNNGGCGGGPSARGAAGGAGGAAALGLALLIGRIFMRAVSFEAAAAGVFLGAAFPPPPEA